MRTDSQAELLARSQAVPAGVLPLFKSQWLTRLCLLLAGAALAFTFAPTSFDTTLPVLAIIVLFYFSVQTLSPRNGLIAGWFFGLGYFALGVHWVYYSIHLFGAAVVPLAAAVTALFVLVMTVFPALTVWAYLHLRQHVHKVLHAVLFASLWVLLELARGKIMGGFPWILLGYAQTSSVPGALAPFIGVYGIGFVMVLVAALVVDTRRLFKQRLIHVLLVGVFLLAGFGALQTLNKVELSSARNTQLNIRLVQANIPQSMKFSQEHLQHSLQQYTSLTLQNLGDIDLVIWPETAIPTYFDQVDNLLEPFATDLQARGVEVLTGGFHRDESKSYNAVRQLAGDKAMYLKRHLVPFGEYMPFRFLLDGLASYIDIPMSDLGRGTGRNMPLKIHGEQIGVSICYEDVFGEEMRAVLPDATVLVNVSNDAWFGDSAAPHQHRQKAQMRAREMARPMVRVTNTGVSSVIDHKGQLLGSIEHNKQGVLDTTVVPRTGMTPYARTGNWPVALLALLCVLFAYLRRRLALTAQH